MATLELDFQTVYTKVSEFIGSGSSPAGAVLTKVKDITHRGYRKYLYPINMSTGKRHVWKFLTEHSDIITTADKWVYELPAGFSGKLFYFEHDTSTVYPTLKYVSVHTILNKRKLDNSSSYPSHYAIRPGRYDKVTGQFYELLLYETPNSAYKLLYSYNFDPPQLTATTDVFIGGVRASEAILECALAVAELQEDDVIGIHNQEAVRLVQELILADVDISPDRLGYNLDPSIRQVPWQRYLEPIPENEIYI